MPLEWKPIDELWLRSQERLALGFKGSDIDLVKWIFLRILDSEYVNATPYTLNMESIATRGGTTSVLQLKDGDNEILDVTEDYASTLLKHVALGYKTDLGVTDNLRIYHQFPVGKYLGEVIGIKEPVEAGKDYSYITAMDSPFDRPTEAAEFFVPYTFNIGVAFANTDRIDRLFPSINIVAKDCLFEILDPYKGDKDTKLLISQMAHGRKICRFKVMGPLNDPSLYKEGLSRYWEVEPISLRDARKLGGA